MASRGLRVVAVANEHGVRFEVCWVTLGTRRVHLWLPVDQSLDSQRLGNGGNAPAGEGAG